MKNLRIKFECEQCEKEYSPFMITQRFCNQDCAKDYQIEVSRRFCATCGLELTNRHKKRCDVCINIKKVTTRLRFEVFKRDGFKCTYCGRNPKEDDIKLHVDHVIPLSKQGTNEIKNLTTSCQDCNLGKSNNLL